MRWLLLGLLVCAPRVGAAQNVVAKLGVTEEYVAGGLGNLILRAPIVAPGWRKPMVRAAVFFGASTLYETLIDVNAGKPYHDGWGDWGGRAIGYVGTEAVIWSFRKVFHRAGR